MKNNFYNKSYISVEGLTKSDISFIFKKMEKMRKIVKGKGYTNSLQGKVLTALFYEPSTRTFSSFVAAMEKLGGSTVPNRDITSTSVVKGESLEDTIRTLSKFSDILVLRHPDESSAEVAVSVSTAPVINGGNGSSGGHPAHALHDLWTIHEVFKKLEGLRIVMVGDLAHYRNVNSLSKLLGLFKVKVSFIASRQTQVQNKILTYLKGAKCAIYQSESLGSVIEDADVLYVTRVKKEYMSKKLYESIKNKYIIDKKVVSKMKKKSIIMHPLPRINEIKKEVDNDHRAIYFTKQLENGLYGKMAILEAILEK